MLFFRHYKASIYCQKKEKNYSKSCMWVYEYLFRLEIRYLFFCWSFSKDEKCFNDDDDGFISRFSFNFFFFFSDDYDFTTLRKNNQQIRKDMTKLMKGSALNNNFFFFLAFCEAYLKAKWEINFFSNLQAHENVKKERRK